jgi:hypothetical protein
MIFNTGLAAVDLGFPNEWGIKDTIIAISALIALLLTWASLTVAERADRAVADADVPEIRNTRLDDTEQQQVFAVQRAVRRAGIARAQLDRRYAGVAIILAVVAADVAAMPWLFAVGILMSFVMYARAARIIRRGRTAIELRSFILEQYRELARYSLSTPYLMDSTINSRIESVYTMADEDLPVLEADLRLVLIDWRNKHRAYVANRRREISAQNQNRTTTP